MIDTNPYFLLSQTGLALATVSGMLLIHLLSQDRSIKRTWYYYVSVWIVSLLCVFQFADDASRGMAWSVTERVWKLRLGFGLERLAVFISYRYAVGTILSATTVSIINRYVAISSALLVIGLIGYNTYISPDATIRDDLESLTAEVRSNRAAIVADTVQTARLLRTIDSLTVQGKRDQVQILDLTRELIGANHCVTELTDVVISLKRAINRLGASVERIRRADIDIVPPLLQPKPALTPIPTDRVKPVPIVPPGRKRGRYGYVEEESDSLFYAKQH